MKLGFSIKIDVTKIDKSLLYRGQKGVYLDAVCFMNPDEEGQYGDHGIINQSVSKEARELGEKGALLGNVKVFWRDNIPPAAKPAQQPAQAADDFDSDVPF